MPTYEYRCNACGKEFEYQQRMADDDLVTCEACGQPKLEKLISRTAFQLKGGGWYKDLYSSNPKEAVKDGVDKGVPPASTDAAAKPAAESSTPSAPSSSESSSSSSSSTPAPSTSGTSGGGTSGGGSTGGSTTGSS